MVRVERDDNTYINLKHNDFSNRLGYLLGEKTSLKLNYQDIDRDLKLFGCILNNNIQPKSFNQNLDKIRLKFSLGAMSTYLNELFSPEENINHIDDVEYKFQNETLNSFKILSRDYQNMCITFDKQLNHTNKTDLPLLEKIMQEHLHLYNPFSDMISYYFDTITRSNQNN
jgi:hypothetical protein